MLVHHISCTSGESSLEVEIDRSDQIAFALLQFCSLFFLVGLQEPLEVVCLELMCLWMVPALSNGNDAVPFMHFLVHLHSLFYLVLV